MTTHEISLTGGTVSLEHQERTTRKFRLLLGETTISLPVSAFPFHVDRQGNEIFLWVEVPINDEESADQTFQAYRTGQAQRTDVCHAYVGSVLEKDTDLLMWHVYATHTHTPEEIDAVAVVNSFIGQWESEA